MTRLRESMEELLELLWTAREDDFLPVDRRKLPQALRCFMPHPIENATDLQGTVDQALSDGFVEQTAGGLIQLSQQGQNRAELIVRRHRLTESLLAGVLDISEGSVESTACQMEHVLNAEVTDAVCAFLGHPPICPHGRPIPRGNCCVSIQTMVAALIIPLAKLEVGESARISFIHTKNPQYLQRLTQLGLAPGSSLKLRRRRPTLVVEAEGTELALDQNAGGEIFVRRSPTP